MNKLNLTVKRRSVMGRKTKNLRLEGILPANVYGNNAPSEAVSVGVLEFKKIFEQAGETGLIELDIEGSKKHVLVSGIQVGPVNEDILHVDFRQVSLTEKVEAQVPIEIEGESPAEKSGIGTVVAQLSEIEVRALPLDLPENFIVDVSTLTEVDQAIFVKDMKYDKSKIEILDDLESIIVKIEPPQKEEVVEVAPVETEITAEGEKPVEATEETPKESEETAEQA